MPLSPRTPNRPTSARRRRWIFRATTLLGAPTVLLALIEFTLRSFDVGYPTSFLLRESVGRQSFLRENPQFGRRFFPGTQARTPLAFRVVTPKPANTFRVLVLGESAAQGDPEPDFGLARQLVPILELQRPGQQIEVINAAMTAINSHALREIARDCSALEADLWILYAGNNEIIGPYGPGTVFGPQAPPQAWVRSHLFLLRSRMVQLLSQLRRSLQSSPSHPNIWMGLDFFSNHPVPQNDPRLLQANQHFAENLTDIIHFARSAGASVIVSTVAVNLRDCGPFLPSALSTNSPSNVPPSASSIPDLANAFQSYQAAKQLLKSGRTTEAQAEFISARNSDPLRCRADSRINTTIRTLAQSLQTNDPGILFVDFESQLAQATPDGIPGAEWFWDHVHLNFAGNYQLARAIGAAPAISAAKNAPTPTPVLFLPSQSQVEARLGYTSWHERRIAIEMRSRLARPPFTRALENHLRLDSLARQIERLRASVRPEALDSAIASIRLQRKLHAGDWELLKQEALLLESYERPAEQEQALQLWRQLADQRPNSANAWHHVANLLFALRHHSEAEAAFNQALAIKPDLLESLNGRAATHFTLGNLKAAEEDFRNALAIKPDFFTARFNYSILLQESSRHADACLQLEAAIAENPLHPPSRLRLAQSLAHLGRLSDAQRVLSNALQRFPTDPEIIQAYQKLVSLSPAAPSTAPPASSTVPAPATRGD